jgi:outer membrane lipoprotein-sorting protein
MNRRTLLMTASAALMAGQSVQAEPLGLDEISGYLNNLVTAETRFTQYDINGFETTGMLYIQRPGRMRFEYDPPNEALVLASANTVAIFDAKSNAPPQQFPLKRTPLNLILGRNIDLAAAEMVAAHTETEDGMTVITAGDPKNPDAGTIELFFAADPVALRQWVVTDEVGGRTAVVLGDLIQGETYGVTHFSIQHEKTRRGF